MKEFYYFSKNKLKFVEIRNFYSKFVFLILFFSTLISFFVFGGYFVVKEIFNPDAEVKALQSKNREITKKLNSLLTNYKNLSKELQDITKDNNDLRLAVDLKPLTAEDRNVGVGGKIFEIIDPSSAGELKSILEELDFYLENVTAEIKFEKNNYTEIKDAFNYNKRLYETIPAIRPLLDCSYGSGFGLRFHPILKVNRMHEGQDLITDMGTKVYAPGGGRVEFVGYRGGLGLVVEIDHGYGYQTIYGHLSEAKVTEGQKVERGDIIALTGNSGELTTGPHLHYEVHHNGIILNPLNFMFEDIRLFDLKAKK